MRILAFLLAILFFTVSAYAETTRMMIGKWLVTTSISEMEDSKEVFASSLNVNEARGNFGKHYELGLRCKENRTSINVDFNDYYRVGSNGVDSNGVDWGLYRIDKEKAVRRKSGVDAMINGHRGLWTARGYGVIPFIRKLLGKKKLLVRDFTNKSPVTAIFDITGIDEVIKHVADTCGWKLGY